MKKVDYEAEAADIRQHLAPYVSPGTLVAYIGARCHTHQQANRLFKKDLFYRACLSASPVTIEEEANDG